MDRNYSLGDQVPFEWSASKTLKLGNGILEKATIGAVGYAQWQTSDNQIDLSPATRIGQSILNRLEGTNPQIYAAGPSIQALTKFGLFELRYPDEFGARATPSGQQLMFSVTLAGNPLHKN
jgi:hypothetical protein